MEKKEAPEFVKSIKDVNIQEGESAQFEIQVRGEPAPQVTWYHNQQPLQSDSVYQILPGENGESTLFISEAFPEDSGVYTVRAFNDVAEVECSATLTVQGESHDLNNIFIILYLSVTEAPHIPAIIHLKILISCQYLVMVEVLSHD